VIRRAALAVLLAAAACAPKPEAPAAPPPLAKLDCARGFEALALALADQPGLVLAPKAPGEPYRYYNAEDGRTSYVVTEPGAPGHPAIVRQATGAKGQVTEGCPFGDRGGYDELLAYLETLNLARVR
jgi:hypothetical protein